MVVLRVCRLDYRLPPLLQSPVDEPTARFLTGGDGKNLLETVSGLLTGSDAPTAVLALRKRGVEACIAAGAVAVAEARRRARARFPDADRLFFTPDALAQATSPVLAAYHAAGLARFGAVADLCCGVGIDAIALAEAGATVTAIEIDPARLVFARANAEARGVAEAITFVQADVTEYPWQADAVYQDPSRRASGDRGGARVSRHADRYEPPLSFLSSIQDRVRGGCVKLSPALPDDVLEGLGGRVEFLSENRECKEACLWFGEARGASGDMSAAAVLLPQRRVVPASKAALSIGPLGTFVFDPDPAIVRTPGALTSLAEAISARAVSGNDAYLTGDTLPNEPRLASAYRVLETLPYQPRRLGERLRARGVGRLVVKKRHFPKEPAAVARELGLNGHGSEATLIVARVGKSFFAVVCEPMTVSVPEN